MRKIVYLCIVFLAFGGMIVPLHAQQGAKPMQKIQQFKKMKLLETLDLDEETANKFLAKYDKWEKNIWELNQQRIILAQQLRLDMEKKVGDDELNRLLDSLYDCTVNVDNARHQMFTDLRSVLTPTQAGKLALFEAQFEKRLHETLERLQQRREQHFH